MEKPINTVTGHKVGTANHLDALTKRTLKEVWFAGPCNAITGAPQYLGPGHAYTLCLDVVLRAVEITAVNRVRIFVPMEAVKAFSLA